MQLNESIGLITHKISTVIKEIAVTESIDIENLPGNALNPPFIS